MRVVMIIKSQVGVGVVSVTCLGVGMGVKMDVGRVA